MADLERTYNVPLRKAWLKSPKYKRAKKAVNALKIFLSKHMKSEVVKIGRRANMLIWKDGIKNPPHHIVIKATKDKEDIVRAELVGYDYEMPTVKETKKAKSKLQQTAEKLTGVSGKDHVKKAKPEEKIKDIKKEAQEKAREIEKEELKELKNEPASKEDIAKSTVEEKDLLSVDKKNLKSGSNINKPADKQ